MTICFNRLSSLDVKWTKNLNKVFPRTTHSDGLTLSVKKKGSVSLKRIIFVQMWIYIHFSCGKMLSVRVPCFFISSILASLFWILLTEHQIPNSSINSLFFCYSVDKTRHNNGMSKGGQEEVYTGIWIID